MTSGYSFNRTLTYAVGAFTFLDASGLAPCDTEVLVSGAADAWLYVDAGGLAPAVVTDVPEL